MADPLDKLFGSAARVKLLRLFLFNPKQQYTVALCAQRARVPERTARKEVALFKSAKLVHRVPTRRGSGPRFMLNENFAYVSLLRQLLLNAPERAKDLFERARGAGVIKVIIVAGVFMGEWEEQLDVLFVGDRIKEPKLRARMRTLESELGRELRYAVLNTEDFLYRLNMNDKLVRDVLDYPHRLVFDRLNIGLK